MDAIDKIIQRIIAEGTTEKKPQEPEPLRLLAYRCEHDGYDILYSESTEKAIYQFDGQSGTMEVDISVAQRDYFVESKYWQR